jgi:hypothetical protein
MVEHILEPHLEFLQFSEINNEMIVIEFVTGEMKSNVSVVSVNEPAVSIVVRLPMGTRQIVKRLCG